MKAKDILYQIKDKHNIGTAWQLTEHIIIEAMELYAHQFNNSKINLNELEQKLDDALGKETRETLTEWIKLQR